MLFRFLKGGLRLKVQAHDYEDFGRYKPLIDLYMMDFPLTEFSTTKKIITVCGTRNAQNGVPLTEYVINNCSPPSPLPLPSSQL